MDGSRNTYVWWIDGIDERRAETSRVKRTGDIMSFNCEFCTLIDVKNWHLWFPCCSLRSGMIMMVEFRGVGVPSGAVMGYTFASQHPGLTDNNVHN